MYNIHCQKGEFGMNKKEKLIRHRARLAALLVSTSMLLGGCASSKGFEFGRGEDNSYVALADSFINNKCIDKCYVVEAYNKLTGETELFIAKKKVDGLKNEIISDVISRLTLNYYYLNLMSNDSKLFYQENSQNNFFEFVKETPLYDYMTI